MLKEIKFKGPTYKEITMQQFGLNDGALNRHVGSDQLRLRLQNKIKSGEQNFTLGDDNSLESNTAQPLKEQTVILPGVSTVRNSQIKSNHFTSFIRKIENSPNSKPSVRQIRTSAKKSRHFISKTSSLPIGERDIISDEMLETVLQPIEGIEELLKLTPE